MTPDDDDDDWQDLPAVDNPFTDAESALFQAEGWEIFEASGSVQNDNGDRPFQLQRLDEEAILPDDVTAWAIVLRRAHGGSEPHQKALNFLREHSPAEFEAIIHECSPDGRELNDDWIWPSTL